MDTPDDLHLALHHPALGPGSLAWSDDHDERQWWHMHTSGIPGSTPPIRRPRVLLEMPGVALPATVATVLRDQGYDVTVCGGPADTAFGCPLMKGLRCPMADQADVIIDDLGLTTIEGRAVWQGHEATHPGTPRMLLRGIGDPPIRIRPGREMLFGPLTRETLLEAVGRLANAG
ncbi:MAG TPA: hypothetical protein VFW71_15475 [Actinomycetota bacterium]|nr:hypothetical protein [Actinomycetota bacterium]